jgi:cellulose synthase/poly-beta-1,6-N-acetylglucosamine synthase-like glycosyltransferase
MNFADFYSDTIQLYLYYALLCVFVVQLVYFLGIFSNFSFSRRKKAVSAGQQAVSVVICARNEYYSLEKNLPLILEQDYPDFEVVLVNDDSDDDTRDLLNDLSRKYPNLTVINVEKSKNFFKGKKFPLALGIKSAKNEVILLTDADCQPVSKNWINLMQQQFSKPNVKIVLGYGGYSVTKGFLNKLIQFDTLMIALQYFSYARIGIPYMGVGRNLAYRKSLFIEKKGFVNHYHISSGDDDLFVNQNASRKNTRIEFALDSHTVSEPKPDMESWVYQKRRHAKTGKFYKFYHIILLSLFPLTTVAFYALVTIILIKFPHLYTIIIVISLLLIRIVSQLIVTKKAMVKLNQRNLLFLAPFLEVYLLFFNAYIMLSNSFKQESRWK